MSKITVLVLFAMLTLVFQNCSATNFSAASSSTGAIKDSATSAPSPTPLATPVTCTLQASTANIRVLFMVDNSDSTRQTDPNDQHRIAALNAFLAEYGSKTNLSYSFSYFAAGAKSFSMANGGIFQASPQVPFGAANEVLQALTAFESVATAASTSYTNAFASLTAIVQADRAASSSYKYVVVFASDGQPTDLGGSALSQTVGITELVSNLLKVGGPLGNMTVSSVYFGSASDSQSITNLSAMAQAGGGQFVNTNSTSLVSLDSIVTVPASGCN